MVKNVSNSQSFQKRKVPIIPESKTNVACSRISDTETAQRKDSSSPLFPSILSSFLRHSPQRLDKVTTNVGWDYCSFPPFFSGESGFLLSMKKIPKIPAGYCTWNWVDVVLGCTMGLFWGGKHFFHWLSRGEGAGLLKGFLFHLPSLPSLTPILKNPFFAPLYAYLRTSISTRDFHQIVSFSVEIVPCQKLFCVVTLLAELSAPQLRRKRESRRNKNS